MTTAATATAATGSWESPWLGLGSSRGVSGAGSGSGRRARHVQEVDGGLAPGLLEALSRHVADVGGGRLVQSVGHAGFAEGLGGAFFPVVEGVGGVEVAVSASAQVQAAPGGGVQVVGGEHLSGDVGSGFGVGFRKSGGSHGFPRLVGLEVVQGWCR